MTVIAWDGRTLAADKQMTTVNYASVVTKVHRIEGARLAFAGSGYHAMALLQWFKAGHLVHEWPAPRPGEGDGADTLFVDDRSGKVWLYAGSSPHPVAIEQPFTAMGCGRDYALAAMHLGRTAREAVEVAIALDVNCGCGIDALEPTFVHKTVTNPSE